MMKAKKSEKKVLVGDLVGSLKKRAPFDFAEDWDNVGHLVGDASDAVSGIVAAVNLGPEALEKAKATASNVIVCHHPPIFKPISRLTRATHPYVYEAMLSGISVIALHTNFDLSSETLSRKMAENLGFEFSGFLANRGGKGSPVSVRLGKFITYVPVDHVDKVREAVCNAGAGQIGNYSQCSFSWDGEGTFFGEEGSDPRVGKAGRLERAQERRLEVVFSWRLLDRVIEAAKKAHPYEAMAYDILELAQPERQIGYGFVGNPRPKSADFTFHKLLDNVKQTFQLKQITVVGPALSDPEMAVQRVAFSPGSGSSFVNTAAAKGVDVYICGEVGYHQMLEARQKGLSLMVLGHSYSERFFIETVSEWLEPIAPGAKVNKVFETVHETV